MGLTRLETLPLLVPIERQSRVIRACALHRVANSLQIASIILLKAKTVDWKRRAVICKTLTSESCRLRPCRNSSMHLGPLAYRNAATLWMWVKPGIFSLFFCGADHRQDTRRCAMFEPRCFEEARCVRVKLLAKACA